MKTGSYIAEMLKEQLDVYSNNISGAFVTTDGGANVIAACAKLRATRIPCFAHLLNNLVKTD